MTLNEANKILENRAKKQYGKSIEWLVNQIDNKIINMSYVSNEKTKVLEAYETYHMKHLGNVWCGLNNMGFCTPERSAKEYRKYTMQQLKEDK